MASSRAPATGRSCPWTLWGGVSCMVASGLLAFALQGRAIARAFRGLGGLLGRPRAEPTALDAIETPMSWFVGGQLVSLVALAWLAKVSFNLPIWESIVAVALSFFLSLVACRVTGETDTTPTGRDGQGDPAHLRRAQSGQPEHQPDERQHHLFGRDLLGRPAERPQERLPARGAPAAAVPRAVRRHLHGHRGHHAGLPRVGADRFRARLRPVSRARGADLARRGARPEQGLRRPRTGQALVDRRRRDGRGAAHAAAALVSPAGQMDSLRPPGWAWPGRFTGSTASSSSWAASPAG